MDASVVVTTYRRMGMLAELLAALKPQLVAGRTEAIVVDNCPQASAQGTAMSAGSDLIRYVHEPGRGVVNARNRGVAEARGTYVIFLDDDEVPSPNWLEAWLRQADGTTDMGFGRIVPRLLAPCPPELARQTRRAFSRDVMKPTGADISAWSAYVGTGNAMFHKARCFPTDAPFDPRFNARGGEDVWLIRSLRMQGRRLLWNREAVVEELVPESRMTLDFAKRRKFSQGQMRCILMYGEGGARGLFRAGLWMTAGAVQLIAFGMASRLLWSFDPVRATDFACRAEGGAGKLLWWQAPEMQDYA